MSNGLRIDRSHHRPLPSSNTTGASHPQVNAQVNTPATTHAPRDSTARSAAQAPISRAAQPGAAIASARPNDGAALLRAARTREIHNATSDARFTSLSPEMQRNVLSSIRRGAGNAGSVLDAAHYTPGAGVNITGGTPAQRAEFVEGVRSAMVRSPGFRSSMNTQNGDAAHPITMRVGVNQPGVFVDQTDTRGTHDVDLADQRTFLQNPGTGAHPRSTTADQNTVHFMTEAISEAHSAEPNADIRFRAAHRTGIHAENQFRRDVGQTGRVDDVNLSPGTGEARFRYHGHRDERVPVNGNLDITGPTRHGP